MKKLVIVGFVILLLSVAACQSGGDGPRLVSEWEPTAVGEHPSRPTMTPVADFADKEVPTRQPTPTPITDVEIPDMPPTAVPAGVYVRDLDGFTIQYPQRWELQDEDGGVLRLLDPVLNLIVIASGNFVDEEANYEATLESITAEDSSFFGVEGLTVVSEEEIPFGAEGTARLALLEGSILGDEVVQIYFAYAEDGARALSLIAFGESQNIAARRTTLDTMVKQAQLGGDQLLGYDRDDTLVLLGGEPLPRSLDPASQTGSAAGYVGLLYSGLVKLSPDMQVVPDLAEHWEVSGDGTVYTFTLRDDLKFADERPLTAADVQTSWERAADPETESTTVETYMGDILGLREKLAGEADTISGVRVIDDHTLEVTLDGPKPYFLAKLSYPVSYVVDTETIADKELEDWVYEPNSSGPYNLADHSEDEYYVFERNETYHEPAQLERVVYLLSRVGNPISLFESGEVDVAPLGAIDSLEVRKPSHALHDNWMTTTSLCTTMIQMNNTLAPMDDPLVRRAFALAVDKENLNDLLAEGTNLVAHTIFPPGMPGYDAAFGEEQAANSNNTEAAQAALAASTYADSLPPIVISAAGFGDSERDDLNAMIDMWREALDADVSVEFLDPIDFRAALETDRGHLVSYGWCADYPDPENFVDVLFYTGSEFNAGGYTNPEVDALMEEARVELDVASRLALYQEIEQKLLADVATIPLSHGVSDVLVSDRVEGYMLAPMGVQIVPQLSLTTAEGE
jgi:oligopeptide transport system substrate-binding protein